MLISSIYTICLFIITSVLAIPPKEGSDSDPAKQYLVTDLPGLHENIDDDFKPIMYAGQVELFPENNTMYFFWKFTDPKKSADSAYSKRTIFWLNGGPGCSSMDGALLETGPFRINQDEKVVMNNGSWHKAGDVVYVDQPAGTGFSYTDQGKWLHDLPDMAFYFLKFMEKYYEIYPEEIDNDIYFAGESYAGQYIPYIADAILKRNAKLEEGQKKYNLKSLLIGNGWVSPNEQSLSYLPFFIENKLIDKENPRWMELLGDHEKCQRIVDGIDSKFDDKELNPAELDSNLCEGILTKLLSATVNGDGADDDQRCINMYDFTLRDSWPGCGINWPFELKYVTPFLRNDEVKHDLNLRVMKTWRECSGRVGRNFNAQHSFPSVHLLPDLLKQVPIILFSGMNDIICNSKGTLQYVLKLNWNGRKGFENPDAKLDWIHDDKKVGYVIQERNLTFIDIYNSSHMVPYDLPEVSRALLEIATNNYDIRDVDETNQNLVTYPLGVQKKGKIEVNPPSTPSSNDDSTTSETSDSQPDTVSSAGTSADAETETEAEGEEEPTVNKVARLIQLAVILIVIWGLYLLYASWRARPSPIMKKNGGNGRKKNVQWADQLSRFEEEADASQLKGFFAKTMDRFRTTEGQGSYARAQSDDYIDDIELGEGIGETQLDDFIIGSDDEREGELEQPTHKSGNMDTDTNKNMKNSSNESKNKNTV